MELISALNKVAETLNWSFPGGSDGKDGKASARNAGDLGLIPGQLCRDPAVGVRNAEEA